MISPEELSHLSISSARSDALSYVTILLNMLDRRDWATFKLVALKHPLAFQALDKFVASSEDFNGVTFLHAAVRNNPPNEIVAKIIETCPDSPRARDCLNRTPLHVAAGVGASVAVINHLVNSYPEACNIQDEDGRTPLHFACDAESLLFEGDQGRRGPPDFVVVHSLLSGSIRSASMEDADDVSPLEYAILSNADVKVVKMLQQATQLYMRKSAKAGQQECTLRSHQLNAAA
jgi:ankyrin repeat protein